MVLSQAEDRATQGCDPSVAWDPRVDGPASPRGVGLFFGRIRSRLSSSSTCGLTAVNPRGSTAFRGLSKTKYPYVLRQPPGTGPFRLPASRRPARHKMGMRHRTAKLLAGLADGFPAADHIPETLSSVKGWFTCFRVLQWFCLRRRIGQRRGATRASPGIHELMGLPRIAGWAFLLRGPVLPP